MNHISIENFIFLAAAVLSLCGLVLAVASWLRRNKNGADWAMAVGSLFALGGAIGLGASLSRITHLQSEEAGFMITGIGTMGVIVFTMGFAMDRVQYFRKEKADNYCKQVLPPQS